jgi:hypothetical protein
MTRILDHEVTSYLRSEADRVVVHDILADIEDDITFVPVTRSSRQKGPALLLMAAAAAVAVVVGLVVASDTRPLGESTAAQPVATVPATTTTTAPETTPPTTVPLARVPLPAGAVLQGVTPSCTTLDSIEYDCTIAAYPDIVGVDMTGYATIIVDDTSHVSGGCRATSPDALRWTCYVGQRAVDEEIVGAEFFGDFAPREYAAG